MTERTTLVLANISIYPDEKNETSADYKTILAVAKTIQIYYLWIIFGVGIPGNVATLITVLKMKPVTSLTAYVAVLAIVDLLAIIVKLVFRNLQENSINIYDGGCKFMIFFGNFLISYASWILVAMATERFVAVWFPLKVGSVWNCKKSLISLCIMFLVIFGIFGHLFATIKSHNGNCQISEHFHKDFFIVEVWYWVNATVYAFLPCILLFLFNLLIIVGIKKSVVRQRSLMSYAYKMPSSSRREVSVMLIMVSVVFLILTTPRSVLLLLVTWSPAEFTIGFASKELTHQIAFVLCDSNHAVNFLLYFLSVRRFRHYALNLMKCQHVKITHKTINLISLRQKHSSSRCHYTANTESCDIITRSVSCS